MTTAKHWQDHEVHFRKKCSDAVEPYPEARGLSVYLYGGRIEECIARAREQFKLGPEWEVVQCAAAS